MLISEMQAPPIEPMDHLEDVITGVHHHWTNGQMEEATYHSQLAHLYSVTKSVDECRQHAALVPDTADADDKAETFIALARMLVYEHKIDEAINYYDKALKMDASHTTALEEIAWCHYHLKHFAAAEKCFQKAITETPGVEKLWEGLALSASYQQKYTEAINYFTKAMQLQAQPLNMYYYEYMIGLCYSHLQDFYRALSHYTKSLDANPCFAHSLNNMASLYFEHEADVKTAINYLQKAEAIAEAGKDIQMLELVYINMVRLYTLVKEYNLKAIYETKLFELLGFGDNINDDDE